MVEDRRPPWTLAAARDELRPQELRGRVARAWQKRGGREAVVQFERSLEQDGWRVGEVLDPDEIRATFGVVVPPQLHHRRIDGGHVWIRGNWRYSDDHSPYATTVIVMFPGAGLPHVVAWRGMRRPRHDVGMPQHLIGTMLRGWRVHTHFPDWATFVGEHLAASSAWNDVRIDTSGPFVLATVHADAPRPELGDLTLRLATQMVVALREHGRPRYPRPRRADEPDERSDPVDSRYPSIEAPTLRSARAKLRRHDQPPD